MNMTRYQALYRKKPSIGHMRMFGAVCYAKEYDVGRKLWDAEAVLCRMMGYGADFNPSQPMSWYLYNTESKRFIFTQNVVFNELLLVVKMSDSATRLLDESEWNANRESAPAVVSMGGNVQVVAEKVVAPRSLRSAAAASESEEDTADVSLVATSEAHPASRKRAVDEDIADDLYTRDVKKALAARVLAPDELNTPKNLREALASPDVSMWNEAIASEIKSLVSNKTFKVIPRKGLRVHTLGTKWVFKIKHDKYGNVARYKARCTALGNLQREGVDYDETYSPVVRHSSAFVIVNCRTEEYASPSDGC
jgi:Reverse transcriptase (RNA-dependent DNA polymerase)